MRYLTLMALLTGLVSVAVGARAAIGAPATSCTTCHRGIEDAHPKKALTCTRCHRGDATAQAAGKAHTGTWANPSDLRVVEQRCGAACHMPYAEDGRYQGGDVAVSRAKQGRPMRHVLTRQVPITQCATCHNGGSRAAMNFRGMMEAPPEGKQTFVYDQDLLHGHAYSEQTPDVHFTKGMVCIDCHTEREVHGDGQIYAKRHYEVEIRCETCHGTPDRIATGVTSQGRRLRNVFSPAGPNPTGLVTLVSKMTGATHVVPQPAALPKQPAGHERTHLAKTECFTCHTAWAPTC